MNPYAILGLPRNANDEEIRKRYLELVRRYPPETHPDRFEKISEAYRILKDEESRLRYFLFNEEPGLDSPFEALLLEFSDAQARAPMDFEEMVDYLRKCALT